MSKYKESLLALLFGLVFLGMTWGWLSISDNSGTDILTILFMGIPGVFLVFFAANKFHEELPKIIFGAILLVLGFWLISIVTVFFIVPIIFIATGIGFVLNAVLKVLRKV